MLPSMVSVGHTVSRMWVFIFILGSLVGSFLNVVIDRGVNGESILWGRSHCDFCKKQLHWYELVPIISFVIQAGRCRNCNKRLSVQYPIVEAFTGICFMYVVSVANWQLVPSLLLGLVVSSFIVIFVSDLKYFLIPDVAHLGVAIGSLGLIWVQHHALQAFVPYLVTALGSSFVFFLLWLVTRRRGLGTGDILLAFSMGIFLGFPLAIIAFYIAFLTGATVGVILILQRQKKLKSRIQFGPFLVLATWLAYVGSSTFLSYWSLYFHL